MARLFISATKQNVGKTTTSIGLFALFRSLGHKVHFIKPVGQRYVRREDVKADEDAVLIRDHFGQKGDLGDMSPVTVPSGFTERYVFERDRAAIYDAIDKAMAHISPDVDMVLVEGTGHAGVGSVIDASNADVAKHLGAKAVIIAGGGIGRSIDEICLNRALFEQAGVEVIGAIVNKVRHDKYDKVSRAVRQGLANQGIRCLGVVPFAPELTYPTVRQLSQELDFECVAGHEYIDARVTNSIVAAMSPQNTIRYLKNGTFVIVPGDRVDNILVSIATHLVGKMSDERRVAGILLTGGMVPDEMVRSLMRESHVPVLLTKDDTFRAAARVERLTVKIGPADIDKVERACDMIRQHIDLDVLTNAIGLKPALPPAER